MTGPSPVLELACLAIVGLWVGMAAGRPGQAGLLRRYAVLVAAAWIAEDTCIHAYGFYGYHPDWHGFVDRVPLLVLLIWPVVILSDRSLARHLRGRAAPILAGVLVVADAALIEPVAVRAGLWAWTRPGLFGVPPVGVLGWGIFAACAAAVLDWNDRRGARPWADLSVLLLAPLGTHLGLLAAWWGLFRWIEGPVPEVPAVAVVLAASVVWTVAAARRGAGEAIPPWELLSRTPAATFFMVLLVLHGLDHLALVAWAVAFTPPNLALLAASLGAARRPGRREARQRPA